MPREGRRCQGHQQRRMQVGWKWGRSAGELQCQGHQEMEGCFLCVKDDERTPIAKRRRRMKGCILCAKKHEDILGRRGQQDPVQDGRTPFAQE